MKMMMRCKSIFLTILLFSLLIGCRDNKASVIFETAEGLWKDGKYKEAMEKYEEVVKAYPKSEMSPRAIYKVGIIQMLYLLDYAGALETFKRLSLLFIKGKEVSLARRHIADIYMNKIKDYKRAIFEYQQLIDEEIIDDPDKAQYNISMAYIKLGDFIQARIEFRDLIENYTSSPLIPLASYQIASSFLVEGEGEKAVKEYTKVMEAYPESPFYIESRFGMALALEEMGRLNEALSLYKELEEEYPNPSALKIRTERLNNRLKQ